MPEVNLRGLSLEEANCMRVIYIHKNVPGVLRQGESTHTYRHKIEADYVQSTASCSTTTSTSKCPTQEARLPTSRKTRLGICSRACRSCLHASALGFCTAKWSFFSSQKLPKFCIYRSLRTETAVRLEHQKHSTWRSMKTFRQQRIRKGCIEPIWVAKCDPLARDLR